MRLGLILPLVLMAHAAPPPPAQPMSRTVRVPASVVYEGEAPALRPADFDVSVDAAKGARVTRVQSPGDDLMLLVVLDLAGDLARVDPALAALADRIDALPRKTWVGLLRAQDGLHVLLDPTPDRKKAREALAAVPVTGKAGLLETVETAARLGDSIAAASGVRVAVLYITDSDVRNYREDFSNPVINSSDSRDLSRKFPESLIREKISKLTDTLAARQTPVHVVHLWYSSERLNEAYQTGLLQLAAATGGSAYFVRSVAEVPGAISRAVDTIQDQYTVLVQLPPKTPRSLMFKLQCADHAVTHRARFILR